MFQEKASGSQWKSKEYNGLVSKDDNVRSQTDTHGLLVKLIIVAKSDLSPTARPVKLITDLWDFVLAGAKSFWNVNW